MQRTPYKYYLLGTLLIIFAFNYVDRFALGLLLQEIKVDLQLSDTQLGLLTGIAFALFYSLLGIPIARWADRGNRVTIIAFTTALWSAALALCGFAATFTQLLLIRVGVAVGEAGCQPPAQSLIADYFTRAERPRAFAIYTLGVPLSAVVGYFLAGWLNELYGWRITFVLLGMPGLGLAALAWLTLREPRRTPQASESDLSAPVEAAALVLRPGLKEVFVTLWANVTFRHLLLCWSVVAFFGYGLWQWKPAFFIRSFGIDTAQAGTWLALIYGVCALVGLWGGGEWASRVASHNERLQFRAIAIAYCTFGCVQALMFLSPNLYPALALLAISTVGIYTAHGPIFAAIQSLVPTRMRAMAVATLYLFANLIGMGLGPLAAGVLSDALHARFGQDSLRYALLVLCSGYLWAAWHLWRASKTVGSDLEAAQRAEASIEPSGSADVALAPAYAKPRAGRLAR